VEREAARPEVPCLAFIGPNRGPIALLRLSEQLAHLVARHAEAHTVEADSWKHTHG
jgi:hypothetical protein